MNTLHSHSQPAATRQDFPIVGIGASAGGLDAFRQLMNQITANSGMAYVLVQHLDPNHPSILTELVSGMTKIPVHEITDDIHLAPNTIYVIPENKLLTSVDGVLKLSPRGKQMKNQAIDVFFTSLAEIHLELAVGIVLSGNGSDGTAGLKVIKEHGGLTFAQDSDATNNEMPQHAIQAGVVDFVLAPADMPKKLLEVMQKILAPTTVLSTSEQDDTVYPEIIQLLCRKSGIDFTYYKQTTIRRRIARRMAISKSHNFPDYLKLLQDDPMASEALFNDLLIQVTEFFRDPKIFQVIQSIVFPALLKSRSELNAIRIWVAGCSTGEEAYTFAIALHEFLGENLDGTQIQIFASDISEPAIAKARSGFYTASQMRNIPEKTLKKYFLKLPTGYQIKRQIRDLCVFAVHNFLKDPPFARMDLISCRNVMIYMDAFLQKKALTTFHYALKETGYLLLGKSETTAPADNLFLPFEKGGKIYTRRLVSGRFAHSSIDSRETSRRRNEHLKPEMQQTDFKKSAESLMLSRYTPASVVVNEQMDIVHMHGPINEFIGFANGKPTFNLLKIAREGLAFELRNAWHKVRETLQPIVKESIQLKGVGSEITIEMQALPDTVEPYFLVVFYKTVSRKPAVPNGTPSSEQAYNLKRIDQLEKELAQIHQDVNAIAEEQESSNEELQSANEELLSSSEELQSLNEELETSKEELQSSNEELILINQELLNKQQQINTSRNYTEAIVDTLREPIVVLDMHLRIKNINRAFVKKYHIAKQEAEGKLIYEIQNHLFDNAAMRAMLEKVLPQKMQLDDYQISVNLLPYGQSIMLLNARQVTNESSMEQLILLAIEDITERRIAEKSLQLLSDGFELKIQERTADLLAANTELGSTVKELNEANIQLQQFAYVASHDLQEPLRKILVFVSKLLMMEKKLPNEAFTILNKISHSSERMKTLIKDLLSYSYLNNHENQFVPTDLNEVLKNILVDFELMIEELHVEVKIGTLPVINAISLQMNQLFYNLISNALKFHKTDGSIQRLSIRSRSLTLKQVESYPGLDPAMAYCELIIQDNGIGFEKQYQHQIFTIFQRLHNNDVYTGTGIGLAIGKKIVDNHNGLIFSKAKENEGAAFHIILPMR